MSQGEEERIQLLLHLRAGGHVKFNLAERTTFGSTAAQMAVSEVLAEKLLVAQVVHDVARVPPEHYGNLIQGGLYVDDAGSTTGCTLEFLSKALALGEAEMVGAAVRLAQATAGTHRDKEGVELASNTITAAFEACPDAETMIAMMFICEKAAENNAARLSKRGLLQGLLGSSKGGLIVGLAGTRVTEVFSNGLLQVGAV